MMHHNEGSTPLVLGFHSRSRSSVSRAGEHFPLRQRHEDLEDDDDASDSRPQNRQQIRETAKLEARDQSLRLDPHFSRGVTATKPAVKLRSHTHSPSLTPRQSLPLCVLLPAGVPARVCVQACMCEWRTVLLAKVCVHSSFPAVSLSHSPNDDAGDETFSSGNCVLVDDDNDE